MLPCKQVKEKNTKTSTTKKEPGLMENPASIAPLNLECDSCRCLSEPLTVFPELKDSLEDSRFLLCGNPDRGTDARARLRAARPMAG